MAFWWKKKRRGRRPRPLSDTRTLQCECLESRIVLSAQLAPMEVETLLDRASVASASEDAIIAVVDRGGRILGVRVEDDVLAAITDDATLVFAIDGAVAKARAAAYFANGEGKGAAPLTSRTVRFISQSTVTQREVESNPNITDPDSTERGPGFVAPIGLGGHFPPGVPHTPQVDLLGIEHTNRDSVVNPGPDRIKGTADDVLLPNRFNIPDAYLLKDLPAPESYGFVSGLLPGAQARGIATLPGGIPIYRDTGDPDKFGDTLIGGIGVFFPGSDGYATHEQNYRPIKIPPRFRNDPEKVTQIVAAAERARTNAPKVIEAEWIAYAAVGGSRGAIPRFGRAAVVTKLSGIPRVANVDLPFGRLDLVGITLEVFGPNPKGIAALIAKGRRVGRDAVPSGELQPVDTGPDTIPNNGDEGTLLAGKPIPQGWLVKPHASGSLTAADVKKIIVDAVREARKVRAAIRLPLGSRTRMVMGVTDKDGNVLGLFRMPDATYFSVDVAVAKARNTAYYADASAIQTIDRVDDNLNGVPDLKPGVAFTNRTFRFLSGPRYPSGVDGTPAGAFSILRDPGIDPLTGQNLNGPLPASVYSDPAVWQVFAKPGQIGGPSVLAYDAFNPATNFRDPDNIENQNGIVFFPGSTPLYKNQVLVGGFGVSGDGVDQDDVVTAAGAKKYAVPAQVVRADEVRVRGVRLPFQKFLRNPHG